MKFNHVISALFTSALLSIHSVAANQYNLKDLGVATLDPFALNDAIQINDSGLIAGYQNGHAIILNAVNVQATPLADGGRDYLSYAKSLVNGNLVVGISEVPTSPSPSNVDADPVQHAALWENGKLKDLGTLGGTSSAAYSINSKGNIVGISKTQNDAATHATLWSNGTIHDLGTLGGDSSDALSINNLNQVAGDAQINSGDYHATKWSNDITIDLGTLGGDSSFASSINSSGQIVGVASRYDGSNHAVIWENNTITDLGSFNGDNSSALGINDSGEIVGNADGYKQNIRIDESAHISTYSFNTHAILWENKQAYDLNTLLLENIYEDSNLLPTLTNAYSINANGSILAHGYIPSMYAYNQIGQLYIYAYQYHSFLLTPVPEPESYALLLAGIGLISAAVKRKKPSA